MKKVLWAVVIAVVVFLAYALMRPASEYDAKRVAENAVKSSLRDPESANFRNLVYHHLRDRTTGGIEGDVCGEVNAKNGFGAYNGFRRFVVNVKVWDGGSSSLASNPVMESNGIAAFDDLWNERCL